MKRFFAGLLLLCFVQGRAQSFSRYLVKFTNKASTPHTISNPSTYLSQRAIDRRSRYGIAIDSTDLPVSSQYLDSIRLAGNVTILNVSKWLNQVSIQTTDEAALAKIAAFPFVEKAAPVAARRGGYTGKEGQQAVRGKTATAKMFKPFDPAANFFAYGASFQQIHLHNGEFLHNIGLRGQNMIIGMLDAGFYRYTQLKAFDSVNQNNQVLGIHDFVARDNSVTEDNAHGMETFSVIAANIPGQFVGTAPKASFYLFRSEDATSEYPIEEHNWVCAAERLDSAGGDVISSSLGYNTFDNPVFNHTYAEMNGNTTIAAIGADLAAKKGILVLNSAGNEGGNSWGRIATPADGDSVLAVGAVTASGVPASFSSRGPSSDGQVKPDVASVGVGTVIQAPNNTIGTSNGTSFACPNITGLATCLWQGFREFNNLQIMQAIRQAGHQSGSPDEVTGYGIPDMRKAMMILLQAFSSASVNSGTCSNTLTWKSKDAGGMQYEIERKTPADSAFQKIALINTAEGSFREHTYSLVDGEKNITPGTTVYRIRQVLDTSQAGFFADYIQTLPVTTTSTCSGATDRLVLYPNPAQNSITLQVNSTEAADQLIIHIYDTKGSLVFAKEEKKPPFISVYSLPVNKLAKGDYFVAVYQNSKKIGTKRFLKL